MGNKEKNRKNRKKIIMRRRIFGVIILLFFITSIGIIINGLINSISNKSSKKTTASNENVLSEEEIFLQKVVSEPLTDFRQIYLNEIEEETSFESIMPFRQQRIREHAMGRITSQNNLKKQVYLTFDDGPSSVATGQVLDILKDYNIKATFFVVGKNVEVYPELLKRIYNEGHSIGIHTYSHDYNKIYYSADNLQEDIEKCLETLRAVLGEDFNTNLYRFPGGSHRKNRDIFINRVEEMGLIYYDWNVLNGDAEGKNPSESYLINRFNETASGYNVIISLMHDTDNKTNSVNSLPEIIEELNNNGYEFKKLGAI